MADNSVQTTAGGHRIRLQAMWACLERSDEQDYRRCRRSRCGRRTVKSGLKQSNVEMIPSDVMMHIFSFLDIMDYICNISIVCKEWMLNARDILSSEQTPKFKLLQQIIYNSFMDKSILKHEHYYLSKQDLQYEMETSVSFALIYTEPYNRSPNSDSKVGNFRAYPPQPLYFNAHKDIRRFTYIYFVNYIYLYKFGKKCPDNLARMYVLLSRLVFVGTPLCIGFMMQLFYKKFGYRKQSKYWKQLIEDNYNRHFWLHLRIMFNQFYLRHRVHVPYKQMCILDETIYNFVKILSSYSTKWNRHKDWLNWRFKWRNNMLNATIAKANNMF